jgi:hypothetical protein
VEEVIEEREMEEIKLKQEIGGENTLKKKGEGGK